MLLYVTLQLSVYEFMPPAQIWSWICLNQHNLADGAQILVYPPELMCTVLWRLFALWWSPTKLRSLPTFEYL